MPCIPILAFNFLLLEADLYTTEESTKIYGCEKQNPAEKKILWPVSQRGGDGEAGSTTSASMVSLRQLVMHNADISDVMLLLRQSANTIMTTWETWSATKNFQSLNNKKLTHPYVYLVETVDPWVCCTFVFCLNVCTVPVIVCLCDAYGAIWWNL